MKTTALLLAVLLSATAGTSFAAEPAATRATSIPNPLIDFASHLETTTKVQAIREQRRLTEEEFLKRMQETGVVVLDARSNRNFARLHISGAVNLDFTEFAAAALEKVIPTKDTPVFIYCNNNFLGSPIAMVSKLAPSSLNISTYVALTEYGYKNVYELGPLLHVKTTILPLAGTEISAEPARQ